MGSNPPEKKPFWGVNRHFQAKLAKSKNMHIIETLASIPIKFSTKYPSWVAQTCVQQIQDGGQPPYWKNRELAISHHLSNGLTHRHEIWHYDAV